MFSLPKPIANARSITASLSTAAGQSGRGGFKVTSQSTGVRAPSANRRQELARCCAHGECYLLVIVVVILCPVWQRINEQHANTFCPNICDRHIFRPASKNWGEKKKDGGIRSEISQAARLSFSFSFFFFSDSVGLRLHLYFSFLTPAKL